ncbi:MAG: zinc ribbon domain-containing protein [Prevotellaceae bacterium]|jgi:hypothetical protein|nr:zinc ribbon domain-containing protein [Prevotellaceae bacterium]
MFCSKCGQQIPDESQFCKHCGATVTATAPAGNAGGNLCKVTVHRKKGYAGALMSAKVLDNGREIGSLSNGETKDFQVEKGSVLVFKCGMGPGTETDPITINTDGKIQLEWKMPSSGALFLLGGLSFLSKKHRMQFLAKLVTNFD